MKQYNLDLGNKKQTKFIQIRSNEDEQKSLEMVRNKINSMSSYFDFSVSDIIRMGYSDFGERILLGELKIKIDLPVKEITFKLNKKGVVKE